MNAGPPTASRLVSSCSTDDAPITAEVTRGSRSTHCSAIWASFWPRPSAISLSRRTWAIVFSSKLVPGMVEPVRAARESSGMPSR